MNIRKTNKRSSELDLNLLRVLVAVHDCRQVGRAALQLGRSQPAVSAALARLRHHFADPLFLRSADGMRPTALAGRAVAAARAALGIVDRDIETPAHFVPRDSDETVVLALSDVGEVIFLPRILRHLREHMPAAAVRSVSAPAEDVALGLQEGRIDLALGYFPDLKGRHFVQQVLFRDRFACLVRQGHPCAAQPLTAAAFRELEHVSVRAESRSTEVMERYLAEHDLQRKIVLTTPHFASAPLLVAQSDLVVIVPEPLARYFAGIASGLAVLPLPFEPPAIDLKQFWHRSYQNDARSRWLRSAVYEIFRDRRAAEPAPAGRGDFVCALSPRPSTAA